MDIINIIATALQIIGGATVLLNILAPLTENKVDDKVLAFLNKLLKIISLNRENGKLEIQIKQ